MSAFYFGCWDQSPGHFLHTEQGERLYRHPASYFALDGADCHIDAQLAPRRFGPRYGGGICYAAMGRGPHGTSVNSRSGECPQGQFLRHVLSNGYTAIQWWDRCQGDTRPGCNSTILLLGEHSTVELLEALATSFPVVLANLQRNSVKLVEVSP